MSCSQYIASSLLLAWLTLLSLPGSVLCQQSQPAQKTPLPPPPPPKPDAKAEETVKQLIAQFDPKTMGWYDTRFSEQARIQGATLRADGRYILGPDYHVRLDLEVKLGKSQGNQTTVCDGKTIWNQTRIAGEHRETNRCDLQTTMAALSAPGTGSQFVENFSKSQAFLGLLPLLQGLHQNMVFTKQEPGRWQNQDVLKLTAVWSADLAKGVHAANPQWQLVPKRMVLYVGTLPGKKLWPYRIEWWGPATLQNDDSLLLEMEFRDPRILKRDDKAAELGKQCTFDPGNTEVIDRTKEIGERLAQIRMQQQQSRPTPGNAPGK
jgi:hypothetical protein